MHSLLCTCTIPILACLDRYILVTYALSAHGDSTTLTLTHERFANADARDGHNRGWSATLDTLEQYLAG